MRLRGIQVTVDAGEFKFPAPFFSHPACKLMECKTLWRICDTDISSHNLKTGMKGWID